MGNLARIFGAFVLFVSTARADDVYLESGRVLRGQATVAGDKVQVVLESGRISIPRSEVLKVEPTTSPLQEAQAREATLSPRDVSDLLGLADFCRDHDLLNKERTLLERVITLEPNHVDARRRLGFVREGNKWLDRSEVTRREQLVRSAEKQQRLVKAQQEAELELAQARVSRERDREHQREAEHAQRAEREAATDRQARRDMLTPYAQPYPYYGPQMLYAIPTPPPSPPSAAPGLSSPGVLPPSEPLPADGPAERARPLRLKSAVLPAPAARQP